MVGRPCPVVLIILPISLVYLLVHYKLVSKFHTHKLACKVDFDICSGAKVLVVLII